MQATQQEVVLGADEVGRRQQDGVEEAEGVVRTTLWRHGGSAAGTLTLTPGSSLAEHTHDAHGHHVWVVSGTAEVLGQRLDPGSYWFVPAGRAHALTAGEDGPCELFWVYEPDRG